MEKLTLILAASVSKQSLMDEVNEILNDSTLTEDKRWERLSLLSSIILSKSIVDEKGLDGAMKDIDSSSKMMNLSKTVNN